MAATGTPSPVWLVSLVVVMMERRARLDLRRLTDTDVDVDEGSLSRLPSIQDHRTLLARPS